MFGVCCLLFGAVFARLRLPTIARGLPLLVFGLSLAWTTLILFAAW